MNYRVAELAAAAGLSVDTVRYYQAKGLLPPPEHQGRVAIYDDSHLAALRRIRELAAGGLSLAVIRRLLASDDTLDDTSVDAKLRDAIDIVVGDRYLTRPELAAETGVPEALLVSVEAAGLLAPIPLEGGDGYTEMDAQMIRSAVEILGAGFPLDELMSLAVDFASAVDDICERAVDLFNDHVRRSNDIDSAEEVVATFRRVLPAVTTVVALQFQRTLIARGRARLASSDDAESQALRDVIADATLPKLELTWR